MHQTTDNPGVHSSSAAIKRKLHETGITQTDLADRLGLTKSAICRGLQRPNGLRTHLGKVAKVLGCELDDLVPARASERSQLRTMFGPTVDDGAIKLNSGCLIKRLTDKQRQRMDGASWVLLQGSASKPLDGTLVLLTKKDGTEFIRKYYRDGEDKKLIVLVSANGSERPVTIKEEDIEDVRMVIAPLASLPQ